MRVPAEDGDSPGPCQDPPGRTGGKGHARERSVRGPPFPHSNWETTVKGALLGRVMALGVVPASA
ncbi:hypothetical protein ATI61_1227 [Archangium gephyra]|uniref:Uncharacterized protein n=1 Tax=Archangium gephyra TaxID=48 RepID=A0ABX9JL38_9BACT|nr:hypothetical protein ATI61_1227 [Archangium gephyra]